MRLADTNRPLMVRIKTDLKLQGVTVIKTIKADKRKNRLKIALSFMRFLFDRRFDLG